MSASVSSDRASVRKRGVMLAYIFANQGWGSLIGSLATLIVLLCYKNVMDVKGETSKVDGVWRIVVGLSLIPAIGTLYQRLTLPEAVKFEEAQKSYTGGDDHDGELKKRSSDEVDETELERRRAKGGKENDASSIGVEEDIEANRRAGLLDSDSEATPSVGAKEVRVRKKTHF